ncbi:MAG: branched-chain amino acid ABC transporter substrate-binding protein [Actinomycetota bacterium]|nr:branched-chain amino acid ABC transporter substrate-binding protein [Actinomycetota bacterium]
MLNRRLLRLAVPVALGALTLTACGSEREETTGGGEGGGAGQTVTIGVIAPLSGDLSEVGNGIKNGVDLAVKQANEKKTVEGYTFRMQAEDDTAKPDVGAQVATKLTSDQSVVGVVGPLNSSVGLTVAPVMSQAGVVVISPSNTGVDLTGRQALVKGGQQQRPYKTYFRVVATDDVQGPFGARYAVNDLKKKSIAVVHDKKAYGQGLAEAFAGEAKKLGATVLPTQTVNPGDKDFSGTVTKLRALKPDFLYYGGEYPEASLLTKQMKAAGLNIPVMGGDGLYSSAYLEGAGAAANGDLATSLGAPTDTLESAKQFVADYQAAGYKEDKDPYGGYAYDAANAIINAVKQGVEDGKSGADLRTAVVEGVQNADFEGVTGQISFDEFGDTKSKVLTVYRVEGGKFVAATTDKFE